MNWKAVSLVAAVAGLALPAGAHACDWTINNMFHRIPSKMSLGVGVAYLPYDGGSALLPSVDLAIGLGDRIVVMPAVGLCHESYDNYDGTDEPIFGGAAAVKLVSSGKFTLNGQTGFSTISYDDDSKYTIIPLMAAGEYMASESASIYFGAGMQFGSVKVAGTSVSESDPALFGGVTLKMGRSTLSGGIGIHIGENDTDFGINAGIRLPLGGS